jgi:PadR family transcriptional regulator, regulatory protein PadR
VARNDDRNGAETPGTRDRQTRVTWQQVAVLDALLSSPDYESHGWALISKTGLGGPSIYRNLERCEELRLVTSRWGESGEQGKPRRRLYRLTPDGAVRARRLIDGHAPRRSTVGRLRPSGGLT